MSSFVFFFPRSFICFVSRSFLFPFVISLSLRPPYLQFRPPCDTAAGRRIAPSPCSRTNHMLLLPLASPSPRPSFLFKSRFQPHFTVMPTQTHFGTRALTPSDCSTYVLPGDLPKCVFKDNPRVGDSHQGRRWGEEEGGEKLKEEIKYGFFLTSTQAQSTTPTLIWCIYAYCA